MTVVRMVAMPDIKIYILSSLLLLAQLMLGDDADAYQIQPKQSVVISSVQQGATNLQV